MNWLVLGLALAVLTLLFTALLAVSWKRWGSVMSLIAEERGFLDRTPKARATA